MRKTTWWLLATIACTACESGTPTETPDASHDATAAKDSTPGQIDSTPGGTDATPSADAAGPTADAVAAPDAGDATGPGGDGAADAALPQADLSVAADAGLSLPPADERPPPLFDPTAPGAGPLDAPVAGLVAAWQARPSDEAQAQAHRRALQDAVAAVRAGGAAAADRITDVCRGVPPHAKESTLLCLRLLELADSPRSLEYLGELAHREVPPVAEGADPIDPLPEALTREVAVRTLGRRAKEGTGAALDALLAMVAEPGFAERRAAVEAVYGALPRVRAKARLRRALPAAEMYRLYEFR